MKHQNIVINIFYLLFQIIARLIIACRPSIQLTKIITSDQLLQLLRIAVWENQQQPWAVHAISCLLQDILDADKHYKNVENEDEGMEVDAAFERDDSVQGACGTSTSSSSTANQTMDICSNSSDSIFKPIQFHNNTPMQSALSQAAQSFMSGGSSHQQTSFSTSTFADG